MKRRTSSTRFGQDDPLTGPLVGHHAGVAFPSYQNLNENNFRNCILTERARPNENEKLKTKHSGSSSKVKTGRGSVGSLISCLPSSSSKNNNYGIFFTTNTSIKQSNEFSVNDKKVMKNLKHIRKMCKDRKGKEFLDRYN